MKKVNVYGIEETLLEEYSGGERRFERIEGTVIASKDVSIRSRKIAIPETSV